MRKITIFLSFLVLLGCKYLRGDECNNILPIEGTYKNIYDKDAKNILIIRKDGTFEQVFTKEGIVKKNNGKWKIFKNDCTIFLFNLKLLHDLPEWEKSIFSDNGTYRFNNIMFSEDLRKEFDYYRVKK